MTAERGPGAGRGGAALAVALACCALCATTPAGCAGALPLTLTLPRPAATPDEPAATPVAHAPLWRSWWFYGAVGVVLIAGAAVAIGANLGGTDRVARGADGRFDPTTFPDGGAAQR